MDRFIAESNETDNYGATGLKSNMDRFIAEMGISDVENMQRLKSNMDRFIVLNVLDILITNFLFKIQYG